MIRTQIQLTEAQMKELKKIAAARGVSLAKVIREAVDGVILPGGVKVDRKEIIKRALAAMGKYKSGIRDLSTAHDKYLAEDFGRR